MKTYIIRSEQGRRFWHADDPEHAREQHVDLFPDDAILDMFELERI